MTVSYFSVRDIWDIYMHTSKWFSTTHPSTVLPRRLLDHITPSVTHLQSARIQATNSGQVCTMGRQRTVADSTGWEYHITTGCPSSVDWDMLKIKMELRDVTQEYRGAQWRPYVKPTGWKVWNQTWLLLHCVRNAVCTDWGNVLTYSEKSTMIKKRVSYSGRPLFKSRSGNTLSWSAII